ncbi:MAG: disulfide bond formation protein B [Gemmataceae bacterium]|nr:disulfide bond formation protein B [Gemmataceae bacterium]
MPFAVLALVFSAAAAAGSLYLSLGMGLKACPLCFYQRAFALGLVGVLAAGLLAFRGRAARVCPLGLPLAVGGVGVAGFHVYLGMTDWPRAGEGWYLACPAGVGGYGTAPQQSLAAFGLVLATLLAGAVREVRAAGAGGPAAVVGLLLGVGAAVGSVVGNPPFPDPKPAETGKPLDTCKPTLK